MYDGNRDTNPYGNDDTKVTQEGYGSYYSYSDPGRHQEVPPYGSRYSHVPEEPKKPKKEKKPHGGAFHFFRRAVAVLLLGVLFGVSAGASFYAVDSLSGMKESREQAKEQESEIREAAKLQEGSGQTQAASSGTAEQSTVQTVDVSDVVDSVMPAMVSITNKSVQTEYFFGQAYQQEATGGGSGIIVGQNDSELLIVTNYHVVENATELKAQFIDDEVAGAKVKGKNSSMDLAVLAVPLADLKDSTKDAITVATMGDSDALKIGEPVIAIGNALGYGQSVTTGVVSALNRQIQVSDASGVGAGNKLIQTDAAINPGNSGGALLNSKGEVIGINSNKIGGEVVEGMGYAIPISSVKETIEGLMNKETRDVVEEGQRGYLGITGLNVTSDVSQMYNMPQGFYVGKVYKGGAADKAGIVKGDIIVDVDGSEITSYEDLQEALAYYAMGDTVEITVMQGSPEGYQSKTVKATLAKQVAQ